MEQSGYWIWEACAFLLQILVAIGLLLVRRRAGGRPSFSVEDRRLFFGPSHTTVSRFRFWINFTAAVLLCYLAAFFEQLIFARFGASIIATAELLTFLGIVKRLLC